MPNSNINQSLTYSNWLIQQKMFLASQKQYFVKLNNSNNYTNNMFNISLLEKAFEENPFEMAPPIPSYQIQSNIKIESKLSNNKFYFDSNQT